MVDIPACYVIVYQRVYNVFFLQGSWSLQWCFGFSLPGRVFGTPCKPPWWWNSPWSGTAAVDYCERRAGVCIQNPCWHWLKSWLWTAIGSSSKRSWRRQNSEEEVRVGKLFTFRCQLAAETSTLKKKKIVNDWLKLGFVRDFVKLRSEMVFFQPHISPSPVFGCLMDGIQSHQGPPNGMGSIFLAPKWMAGIHWHNISRWWFQIFFIF